MGLSIAVFVPDGIAIVSDGLAEIRNSEEDHSFLHKKQKRLFIYENKYVVNIQGKGFYKGLPYSYYVNDIFHILSQHEFGSVIDFASNFLNKLKEKLKSVEDIVMYIAGIDIVENEIIPAIYIIANNKIQPINQGKDGRIVYNYHVIGHCYWINKLLLPSEYKNDNGDSLNFDGAYIDFSKYSLEEAIDFAKSMIYISSKMDYIAQLTQTIGETINVCVIPTYGSIQKI